MAVALESSSSFQILLYIGLIHTLSRQTLQSNPTSTPGDTTGEP